MTEHIITDRLLPLLINLVAFFGIHLIPSLVLMISGIFVSFSSETTHMTLQLTVGAGDDRYWKDQTR